MFKNTEVQICSDNERLFVERYGLAGVYLENYIYRYAEKLSQDNDAFGIKAYAGGYWSLEKITGEDGEVFFWFCLTGKDLEQIRYVNANNDVDVIVNIKTFSMVVNLIAMSNLAYVLFHKSTVGDENTELYENLNDIIAGSHRALMNVISELSESDRERYCLIMRMID